MNPSNRPELPHTRRPAEVVKARPMLPTREKPIIGDTLAVDNVLRNLADRGDLVGHLPERKLSDGRVYVLATVIDRKAAVARRWKQWHTVAALGGGFLAFLVAIGWLFVYTIASAAAWVAAHKIEVVFAVAGVAILLGATGKKCCEVVVTVTHRHR